MNKNKTQQELEDDAQEQYLKDWLARHLHYREADIAAGCFIVCIIIAIVAVMMS